VRCLLEILTEIKFRYDIQNNRPLPSYFFQSSIPAIYHRAPSRFGLPRLSLAHTEVQRFILTLNNSTYLYSPHLSHYRDHLHRIGSIPYLDLFHHLDLTFHPLDQHQQQGEQQQRLNRNINYLKCVHETGHLLLSHLHPFSRFSPQSVFISSSHLPPGHSLLSSLKARFSFLRSSYTLSRPIATHTDPALTSHPGVNRDKERKASRGLICICLGGMAAEYVTYGAISPRGSDNDLRQAIEEIQKTHLHSTHLLELPSPLLSSPMLDSLVALINKSLCDNHSDNRTPLWIDDDSLQIISEEFQSAVLILEQHRQTIAQIASHLEERVNEIVDVSEVSHLFPLKLSSLPVPPSLGE
jgi:hypothetical protein